MDGLVQPPLKVVAATTVCSVQWVLSTSEDENSMIFLGNVFCVLVLSLSPPRRKVVGLAGVFFLPLLLTF